MDELQEDVESAFNDYDDVWAVAMDGSITSCDIMDAIQYCETLSPETGEPMFNFFYAKLGAVDV